MSEDEKRYNKKTKAILVLDCVYLSNERNRLHAEARVLNSEIAKLRNDFSLVRAKNVVLQDSMASLLKSIEVLKNGVGV